MVRRVYLDREFASYNVVDWLRERSDTPAFPLRVGSRWRERGQKPYVARHTFRVPKDRRPPLVSGVHAVL